MTYLTTNEVADLLRTTEVTVQRWIKKGKFPNTVQVDRMIRIPVSDLEPYGITAEQALSLVSQPEKGDAA